MIYVAGWKSAHRTIDLLLKVTLASTLILQLNYEHITFIKADEIDWGEFSPPIYCRGMLEQLIIDRGDKLIITKLVQSTRAHFRNLSPNPTSMYILYGLLTLCLTCYHTNRR